MNQFSVEIDSRESCTCLISLRLFSELKHPFVKLVEKNVVLHVIGDKSVGENFLRVSKFFASTINLKQGEKVSWNSINELAVAGSPIVVSPMTIDDWEVIESQANFLESSILGQIRAVSLGMKFPVFTARGQKPVILQVTGGLPENGWSLLGDQSELAVEARTKREVDLGKNRKHFLRARVVDQGFPDKDGDLLNIGLIVNSADFKSAFGPDGGSLVTIRDRPEILTLVACDSNLVDPGIVLVSPLMRDVYGLTAGERICIEQYTRELTQGLVIPTVVHTYWPIEVKNEFSNSKLTSLFKDFVKAAACIIVPQGGFVCININGKDLYVEIKFEPATQPASVAAAYITAKTVEEILFENNFSVNGRISETSKPFLKYVPESTACAVHKPPKSVPGMSIPSFQPVVERISKFIENSFTRVSPGGPFVSSMLLTSSSPAAGRTTVMRQALCRLDPPVPFVEVDCRTLSSPSRFRLEEVKQCISGLVRFGFESPPFVILFDNVDELIPADLAERDAATAASETALRKSRRGRVFSNFFNCLLRDLNPTRSLVLLGTAVTDSPSLANIFVHSERLPVTLSEDDKAYLLPHDRRPPGLVSLDGYSLSELVEIKFTGVDNRDLRRRLIAGASVIATQKIIPSIGGLDAQISQLVDAINLPLHFPSLFRSRSGKSLVSTGAFVVGPSGCGKSALIDHVVKKVGLPVEIVRGPDLLDKYIGASEQGVRRVFEKAASIAPCVVVFDTIDALCPRRGSESTGVTDRVVNQMLCYLDGVEKQEGVFVIAVTSRPDMVDPALTRPGRLDMVVLCDIPTEEERRDILRALARDFDLELDPHVILELAEIFGQNVTGADIRAAFVDSKIIAGRTNSGITLDLLTKCISEIKPSISPADARHNSRILAKYRPGMTESPEAKTQIGTRVMLH